MKVLGLVGSVRRLGNTDKEEDIRRHRWTEENLWRHFTYHLKPSKDFFMKTKRERRRMVEKYRGNLGM